MVVDFKAPWYIAGTNINTKFNYRINNVNYINPKDIFYDILSHHSNDMREKLVESNEFKKDFYDMIPDMVFKIVYQYNAYTNNYCMVEPQGEYKGKYLFIVREDNLKLIKDWVYYSEKYSIKKLIRNGPMTVLISNTGAKYTTKLINDSDKDDPEKAIMLLLLKRAGYSYGDIQYITNNIKCTDKKKEDYPNKKTKYYINEKDRVDVQYVKETYIKDPSQRGND